jgi:hypothetical protein
VIPCTCGKTEDHIIARQLSNDGVRLELWHSGVITGRLGTTPPGIGRSRLDPRASQVAWQDACLYDWSEIGGLVKAARKALAQKSLPPLAAMRHIVAGHGIRPQKAGRAVEIHHPECPCYRCGGQKLSRGVIASPPKLIR